MSGFKWAAVVAALATVAVGSLLVAGPRDAYAVANGQPAEKGAFPFNVKLTSNDIPVLGGGVRSGACSGALIAPDWVITAGHCFHDINRVRVGGPPPYHMTATIGRTDDSDQGGHVAQVVDVRQSPLNDIAIVRLDDRVSGIAPVSISPTAPTVGQQVEIAGWGATSSTASAPSTHLNLGTFAVRGVNAATVEVAGVSPAADTSACPDDSGAPYFVPNGRQHGTLVSIENDGPDCPHATSDTAARVDVIASWIAQQTSPAY